MRIINAELTAEKSPAWNTGQEHNTSPGNVMTHKDQRSVQVIPIFPLKFLVKLVS
jgi:hypothetical protein